MAKAQELKVKADYRGPSSRRKFSPTSIQIAWQGPELRYKDGFFWKKIAFKDVKGWEVVAEPGTKCDQNGMIIVLHIIKLHIGGSVLEFAISPDEFEFCVYWIIRSLIKHSNLLLAEEQIKHSPLLGRHRDKVMLRQNLSVFEKSHRYFMDALNSFEMTPEEKQRFLKHSGKGEGGTSFGKTISSLSGGGSGANISVVMKMLEPLEIGGVWGEKPVVAKTLNLSDWSAPFNKNTDKLLIKDLIREASVLALLGKHPNIVGLVDAAIYEDPISHEGRLCLYMEKGLFDIEHLEKGALTLDKMMRYTQGILEGISYMHKFRIFHMDMKPANVIISEDDVAKIIDFGLARGAVLQNKSDRFQSKGWYGEGTSGYICPESWDWDSNPRDKKTGEGDLVRKDSYAVGMTIINGLIAPFMGWDKVNGEMFEEKNDVLRRIESLQDKFSRENKILVSKGIGALAEIALGLIAKKPEDRWTVTGALEVLDTLQNKERLELHRVRMSSSSKEPCCRQGRS